ncbi:MAG: hypothetical protein JSW01_06215 [Candidatus Bathyarchaeota archaeon]|nr:MAG: hypothetical protein JSW01_06215 [Candidatus Bathyarchaeota archaeon]
MMYRSRIRFVSLFLVVVLSGLVLSPVYARPTSFGHHVNRIVDGVVIAVTDVVGSPFDQARVRLDKADHVVQEIEDLSLPSEDEVEENVQYADDVVEALGECDRLINEACNRDCTQETLRQRDRVRVRAENATRRALEAVERNIQRSRERSSGGEVDSGLLQARERLRNAYAEQERKRQQEQSQQQQQQNGQGDGKGKGT